MGDGAAAAFTSPSDSLFVRLVKPGLRNASTRMNADGSNPLAPLQSSTSAYMALRERAIAIFQHAFPLYSWMQSKGTGKSSWATSLSILSLGALICFSVMYCYVTLGQRRYTASTYGLVNGEKQFEQDSDDFDYEDDSDEDNSQRSSLALPIRRFLNFRKGGRPGSSARSAGIVRITSSDPRSSLCSVPIQLDMDSKTSVAPTEATQDPAMTNVMQHSASVARRRRESGRLLNGINNNASTSSRTNSPLGRGSPSRKGGSLNHSVSPQRPPRPPRSQLFRAGQDSMSDTDAEGRSDRDIIVPSSSSQTFTSAGAGFEEEEEVTMLPPSILVRQPQVYARKTQLASSNSSHEMYSLNKNASGSAVWQGNPIESGSDLGYGIHLPLPASFGARRLPPGAGHSPSSPLHSPSHKLGSMDPAQIQAYWLERKSKSIRLQEPDWAPYVDVHIRAKERLETAAHVAANPQSTMLSPPPQYLSSKLMVESSSAHGSDRGSHQSGHIQSDLEEEFWFERFTQSTAAAGRDWDWRKRRRQRQMAAAAKEDEETLNRINESAADSDIANAGNVGMTDVQLQKQRNEHARKTSQFTKREEGNNRPRLSLSTNVQSNPASPNGRQTSSSSPFGKRSKRYTSPMTDNNAELPTEGESVSLESSQNGGGKKKPAKLQGKRLLRRQSEPNMDDADVSVPNRLSSLTPKMIRRGLGAKRERDADLTKQLLAEAEEVATDDEDEDKEKARKETEMTASSPRGFAGVRKSSSSSGLRLGKQASYPNSMPKPVPADDAWSAGAGAWSSADAYGSGSPTTEESLHISVHSNNFTSAASPTGLTVPRNTSEYLLGGGEDLRRQGSKADSQSSSSSTSPLPVFAIPRSGSRKGILSSASKAASADNPWRSNDEGIPVKASESYNSLYNNSQPLAMPTQ